MEEDRKLMKVIETQRFSGRQREEVIKEEKEGKMSTAGELNIKGTNQR